MEEVGNNVAIIGIIGLVIKELLMLVKGLVFKSKEQELQEQRTQEIKDLNQFLINRFNKMDDDITTVKTDTRLLYDMHNTKDEDGVYKWYVRKSLEENIRLLAESINTFTQEIRK